MVAAPVLDLAIPGAHAVIGDRALAEEPAAVARLGRAFAAGLLAAGVQPVGKHAPGHGRAQVDSHLALPRVEANDLDADLLPFALNADLPWAMSAHIVYPAWDPALPATLSPTVIEAIIRGRIGFEGVLVTDDLAMKALSGAPADLARAGAGGRLRRRAVLQRRVRADRGPAGALPAADRGGRPAAWPPPGRSRRDGACRWTPRHWPPNGIGCWRDRHRSSARPGRDPRDPGDHPARGGARLRGAGTGRRHRAAGRTAVAQPAAPCRSGRHHLLPGFLLIFQLLTIARVLFMFGWAKPVPVAAWKFRDPRRGMALVAVAGPAMNFFLAWVGALLLPGLVNVAMLDHWMSI